MISKIAENVCKHPLAASPLLVLNKSEGAQYIPFSKNRLQIVFGAI